MSLEELKARAAERRRKEEEDIQRGLAEREAHLKGAVRSSQNTRAVAGEKKEAVAPKMVELNVQWEVDLRMWDGMNEWIYLWIN